MKLEIQKLDDRAVVPSYMTDGAAGLDLVAIESVAIPSRLWWRVRTGLAISIPGGYEGQIRSRSGLAARYGVAVLHGIGTIDSDYRGELLVLLVNHGPVVFSVEPGDRIAQLVICPVVRVEPVVVGSLSNTGRGSGGFGSTGR